jgi:hypothetical protein
VKKPRSKKNNRRHYGQVSKNESRNRKKLLQKSRKNNHKRRRTKKMKGGELSDILHLFTFQTPIFTAKKIQKDIKSIVGISPTMVLLFPLLFYQKW